MAQNKKYRLMVYFASAILMMYSKTIVCERHMSVNDFRNKNEIVVKRVFDEALSLFDYKLSYEQMSAAIFIYFSCKFRPLSVAETGIYTMDHNFTKK